MMRPHNRRTEPIFSRQEQAVVYLFSRYWEAIPEFSGKTILRIHTHFPDFLILDEKGRKEAIEFEYGLSAFCSHLEGMSLQSLHSDDVRRLYIVYWDDNDDKESIRRKIKKAGFGRTISFVCLKDFFGAVVGKVGEAEPLRAAWEFPKARTREAYRISEIEKGASDLERKGVISRLDISPGLYRTICFNKSGSEFIECDHWRSIHFYTTTTRFQSDAIPCRLFVRPSGCPFFDGYFQIKRAFKVAKPCKEVEEFFTEFYFYRYGEYTFEYSTCYIYSEFRPLQRVQGNRLFEWLNRRKYTLGVRGSIKIKQAHTAEIDRLIRS